MIMDEHGGCNGQSRAVPRSFCGWDERAVCLKLLEDLVFPDDFASVCHALSAKFAEIACSDSCNVYLLDAGIYGHVLQADECSDVDGVLPTMGRMPYMLRTKSPIVADLANPHEEDLFSELLVEQGIRYYIVVPLVSGEEFVGFASLLYRGALDDESVLEFQAEFLDWITWLGSLVGSIIRNVQMWGKVAELKVLGERRRIAEEIHDDLAQQVSLVELEVGAALDSCESGDLEALQKELEKLAETTRQTTDLVRGRLCVLKEPAGLSECLAEDLRKYLDGFERLWGIKVVFLVDEVLDTALVPKKIGHQFVRVAREALNNVVRHACAAKARVSLSFDDSRIFLSIEDDGVGFDPNAASAGGYGISVMRERAHVVGGNLVVASRIGEGTIVSMDVPVDSHLIG